MRSLFASALALTTSASALVVLQEAVGSGQASAQEAAVGVISRIRVDGNQRIEARTVQSYMLVEPGDPFDPERIDLSLKTLFATGLFADVLIERDQSDLVVRVIENPIINRVIFEGNSAVGDERLEEETEAEPRAIFTQARVQQDVQRILEVYRRSGRFAAAVTPQYKPLAQNRVDLIFEISEGPTTGVRSINFLGNEEFSDSRLRSEVVTRQSRWWRFFESNDNYDPDRLEFDRELLRQFYTNEGFADFRVTSSVAELTPDQEDFYITFTIDEGVKYDFGQVTVETALEKLNAESLQRIVPIRQGELYKSDRIEDSIDAITFAAGSAGYASVDVRPRVVTNPDTRTVDLTFVVDEGPRVYIERIDITGNTQTLDRVIRREFTIAEGDAFNRILLDQSRNRVRALGYFANVEITESPGSTADRTIVNVDVEEQPTGELAFSAGFSSADAFLFSLSASQRNLRGRGQFLSARIQTTSRQQDIEFRFTEPRFQDRNLAAGVDLFATQSDFFEEAGFENSTIGGGLRVNFPIGDRTSLGLNYRLRQDDVQLQQPEVFCADDVFFRSSLCDQQGERLTSALGYTVARDRRNDPITPTRGYRASFSQEVAGIGGDVNYIRNEVSGSYYRGIIPGFVASAHLDAGVIEGWNDDNVLINNRFFRGGNSFRGFDVAGLGPREVILTTQGEDTDGDGLADTVLFDENGDPIDSISRGNALGGKVYAIGSVELSFPIPYAPEEFGIGGALFSEFGTVGILDDSDRDRAAQTVTETTFVNQFVEDELSLRASVGVSIFWDSPFGPIRFDFSQILAKEEFDRTESFRFSTNTQF